MYNFFNACALNVVYFSLTAWSCAQYLIFHIDITTLGSQKMETKITFYLYFYLIVEALAPVKDRGEFMI